MLEAYIGPIGAAAALFPFIASMILLPLIVLHYWRFGRLHGFRALVFYSFLFYGLAAYFLVILPLPDRVPDLCSIYNQTHTMSLVPFAFVTDTLAASGGLSGLALLRSLPTNGAYLQAFFNFLLLAPLGFYLHYYFRRSFISTALIAFGVTLFFELTQLSGLYWLYPCPYRVFDVDDLILNTGGAVFGYAIATLLTFLPDLDKVPAGPIPVTVLRRGFAFLFDALLYGLSFGLLRGILLPAGSAMDTTLDMIGLGIWFIVLPAVWHGYTPGKRLVFLSIVDRDGGPAALWQVAVRYGVLLYGYPFAVYLAVSLRLPAVFEFLLLAGITGGYLLTVVGWSIFRRDGRGLHDRLARTRQVVTWRAAPLRERRRLVALGEFEPPTALEEA